MTEWWDPQTGNYIGAYGGAFIGVFFGGVGGGIGGTLAPKGKAKTLVMSITYAGIALGIVNLISGGIAVLTQQPYHVYYPLLLIGVILTVVELSILPTLNKAYARSEQQRLDAQLAR